MLRCCWGGGAAGLGAVHRAGQLPQPAFRALERRPFSCWTLIRPGEGTGAGQRLSRAESGPRRGGWGRLSCCSPGAVHPRAAGASAHPSSSCCQPAPQLRSHSDGDRVQLVSRRHLRLGLRTLEGGRAHQGDVTQGKAAGTG